MFLFLVLAPMFGAPVAHAADPCELPTDLTLQAEKVLVEGRFDDMPNLVERFEASLSCSPPVDRLTLAAFLRAEGVWFHLTGLSDEAAFAFQSAARLAPAEWTTAYGEEIRQVYQRAADTPAAGMATLQLEPLPADPHLVVHLNGEPITLPIQVESGIVALQLIRSEDAPVPDGTSRFGTLVAVFPNEDVRVNPGVLPIEQPTTTATTALGRKRPVWLLAAAGGALLASGATAAVALNQPDNALDAQSLAAVNQAERRQKVMAVSSYGLMGAGVVATGLYFVW
jgi:hypothetical protein